MNEDQKRRMYDALKRIARGYQSADQLRRNSERQYGLDYTEALEYAYENMQQDARNAIAGLRRPREKKEPRDGS